MILRCLFTLLTSPWVFLTLESRSGLLSWMQKMGQLWHASSHTHQLCFWSALGWCEHSLLLEHWASPLSPGPQLLLLLVVDMSQKKATNWSHIPEFRSWMADTTFLLGSPNWNKIGLWLNGYDMISCLNVLVISGQQVLLLFSPFWSYDWVWWAMFNFSQRW